MKKKEIETKTCLHCGIVFIPKYKFNRPKYCSKQCVGKCAPKNDISFRINGDCWECSSHASNSEGYPRIDRDGKQWRMSRYIYTTQHGEIPEGLQIRHTCDNRLCINPMHLLIGTNQDNMDDKVSRNRQARGETHGKSKLTEQEVLEIRKIGYSKSKKELGRMYGVSYSVIHNIRRNKTWKHIQ